MRGLEAASSFSSSTLLSAEQEDFSLFILLSDAAERPLLQRTFIIRENLRKQLLPGDGSKHSPADNQLRDGGTSNKGIQVQIEEQQDNHGDVNKYHHDEHDHRRRVVSSSSPPEEDNKNEATTTAAAVETTKDFDKSNTTTEDSHSATTTSVGGSEDAECALIKQILFSSNPSYSELDCVCSGDFSDVLVMKCSVLRDSGSAAGDNTSSNSIENNHTSAPIAAAVGGKFFEIHFKDLQPKSLKVCRPFCGVGTDSFEDYDVGGKGNGIPAALDSYPNNNYRNCQELCTTEYFYEKKKQQTITTTNKQHQKQKEQSSTGESMTCSATLDGIPCWSCFVYPDYCGCKQRREKGIQLHCSNFDTATSATRASSWSVNHGKLCNNKLTLTNHAFDQPVPTCPGHVDWDRIGPYIICAPLVILYLWCRYRRCLRPLFSSCARARGYSSFSSSTTTVAPAYGQRGTYATATGAANSAPFYGSSANEETPLKGRHHPGAYP